MPEILQCLLGRDLAWSPDEFERKLFLARNHAERAAMADKVDGFYCPSFSARTIVYKGLFNAPQLPKFYLDLKDPLFVSALAIFHQRYSTNTFPTWHLAHPFRMLAHNGEINTLLANKNWTRARGPERESVVACDEVETLGRSIKPGGSASAVGSRVSSIATRAGGRPTVCRWRVG